MNSPELKKNTPDHTEVTPAESAAKKRRRILMRAALPVFLFLAAVGIFFLPKSDPPNSATSIRTLSVPNYPLTLVLEERDGRVVTALLRTPAGTRELEQMRGMSYLLETSFLSKVDQDEKEDLLWRVSFMNFEGSGVHLWFGMLTWSPRIFIAATPYEHARWDAVPAKIIVPKGTALYVAPEAPSYETKETLKGKDAYTFVYTIRMTPEGPAFVPVSSVYSQLAVILRAGIRGELRQARRVAYLRMLGEFNRLASGEPPQSDTILNFQINRIDTLSWRK